MPKRRGKGRRGGRKPVVEKEPGKRSARVSSAFPGTGDQELPSWRFGDLDRDFELSRGTSGNLTVDMDIVHQIRSKLEGFETINWQEIERNGSHSVERWKLAKAAQDRLDAIGHRDLDELFSLRLTGPNRVWGIRKNAVLSIVWWDPEHLVCPSLKR
ncbi:MAG: hypothetical protein DHS20C21_01890 [Gemmatimonadota bacterium]|nr:MAG: hypothetical protein DHS20C21_01890 [Gemmatimonadota bacterium]